MYISLLENSRGHPDNVSFMQFSTKIDGFEQKDSQGFENSYNSYEQYPLEKFFIFTIYQNYTSALIMLWKYNFFQGFISKILPKTLISCRAMQLRFFKVTPLLKNAFKGVADMEGFNLFVCVNLKLLRRAGRLRRAWMYRLANEPSSYGIPTYTLLKSKGH